MKKHLLIFILFLFPITSYANEAKFLLLKEAETHKQEAIKALNQADDMRFYIPDLGKREHMHAIINSSIGSIPVSDPKVKVLCVGLALIGSLATSVYDQYDEYTKVLVKAAYHIEMYNFCSSASMKVNKKADEGTKAFLDAIDCLTLCDMMLCLIDDKIDWEMYSNLKENAIWKMLEYRDYFISVFEKCKGKLCKKLSADGWTLYENLDEILSEYGDRDLANEIVENIWRMVKNLEKAEEAWGIK